MTDIETMIKALRLAWIPRLIQNGHPNWKFVPDHLFNEKDILFQICFFFIKPDKSTKISLKRVRFVMINDLRYFS